MVFVFGILGALLWVVSFMSEARSVTNFSGNAVATVLVGSLTNTLDTARMRAVLAGRDPFDESTMVDTHDTAAPA